MTHHYLLRSFAALLLIALLVSLSSQVTARESDGRKAFTPNWDEWAMKRLDAVDQQPQRLPNRSSWKELAQRLTPTAGAKLQSTVSLAEAQALYDLARAHRIGFKNPDLCWLRAHVVAAAIERRGIEVHKVKVSGNLRAGDFAWGYHIAPAVMVRGPDGKQHEMVFDPALVDRPATREEWMQRMGAGPRSRVTRVAAYKLTENDPATGWERGSLTKALYMGNVGYLAEQHRARGPYMDSRRSIRTTLGDFSLVDSMYTRPRARRAAPTPSSSTSTKATTLGDFGVHHAQAGRPVKLHDTDVTRRAGEQTTLQRFLPAGAIPPSGLEP